MRVDPTEILLRLRNMSEISNLCLGSQYSIPMWRQTAYPVNGTFEEKTLVIRSSSRRVVKAYECCYYHRVVRAERFRVDTPDVDSECYHKVDERKKREVQALHRWGSSFWVIIVWFPCEDNIEWRMDSARHCEDKWVLSHSIWPAEVVSSRGWL